MLLKPRDYQREAVYRADAALRNRQNPIVKLPTGSGKSIVLALLIQLIYERARSPMLVLSHVKELLEQDSKTLRKVDALIPQTYYCAGLGEKRGGAPVVFGSVQTVSRSPRALGARSFIFIDEAHLCPRDTDAQYSQVFDHFSLALRAGFTATDQRLDSGKLTEGDSAWFDCIAHDVPVEDLIKQGYLVPLSGVLTEHQADMGGVDTRMGDYVAGQAEEAVMKTLALSEAVQDAMRLAKKRRHWLIFAAGVAHARVVLAELQRAGIKAKMVLGDTPDGEREQTIDEFREGSLRALVNVGVLTTGFDAPQTDCIISLRPTKSPVLWTQMMGRGMRLADGKQNCLLLDFVGNLERLGGAGCVVEIKDERDPVKVERPVSKRKGAPRADPIFGEASLADPMKSGQSFECRVEHVRYFIVPSRRYPGKRMVVASYDLEDEYGRSLQAKSFVCVEFPGQNRYHAVHWFMRRGISDSEQVPRDSLTALALAKVSPAPAEVRAYWDPRMKSYLIMEERFAAP
jgi:superfamily II DNA or RNA helicase